MTNTPLMMLQVLSDDRRTDLHRSASSRRRAARARHEGEQPIDLTAYELSLRATEDHAPERASVA